MPGVLSAGPDFSFFGSLLRLVSSIPLSFRRLTLRCSAVVQILRSPAVTSILLLCFAYIKTALSQGPRLEDRRPPQVFKDPLAKRVEVGLKPGDREMVVDRGGHFSPAGIDGVHICLYYYRPLQHITVLRVTQEDTI